MSILPGPHLAGEIDAFAESRHQFETVAGWLDSADAGRLEHAELESRLEVAGRELLRRLLQDHLDLRAHREPHVEVLDCDAVAHRAVERPPAPADLGVR